jgi:hypothetical protein
MFGRKPEGKGSVKPTAYDDPEAMRARRSGWHLPDMEAGHPEDFQPAERARVQRFRYEDGKAPPVGEYLSELIGWQTLDAQRVAWRFQLLEESGAVGEAPGAVLEIRSGVVCRPGNHLHQLLRALGGSECAPLDLGAASPAEDARDVVNALDPDTLLHRRCRLQIEHVRDDLGDVQARIAALLPLK